MPAVRTRESALKGKRQTLITSWLRISRHRHEYAQQFRFARRIAGAYSSDPSCFARLAGNPHATIRLESEAEPEDHGHSGSEDGGPGSLPWPPPSPSSSEGTSTPSSRWQASAPPSGTFGSGAAGSSEPFPGSCFQLVAHPGSHITINIATNILNS